MIMSIHKLIFLGGGQNPEKTFRMLSARIVRGDCAAAA
jgi:hypothetical protein